MTRFDAYKELAAYRFHKTEISDQAIATLFRCLDALESEIQIIRSAIDVLKADANQGTFSEEDAAELRLLTAIVSALRHKLRLSDQEEL